MGLANGWKIVFNMGMHEPDIGSIVTSVKGPNMVYHSKENISEGEMNIKATCIKTFEIQSFTCCRVLSPNNQSQIQFHHFYTEQTQ